MTKPRLLVACEYSGITRDAFTRLGWDAWSCDLLPTEAPGQHYQGDVRELLSEQWDLLIDHPPCTYLSYAANRYWNQPGREEKRREAAEFFMLCVGAPVEHICIENPLGIMSKWWRKYDQLIHPYYFGDRDLKRTCLWTVVPPMTPLQATFEYCLKLQKLGYSKAEIDNAYRQAAPPCSTDAVLVAALANDLTQRLQKQEVRG